MPLSWQAKSKAIHAVARILGPSRDSVAGRYARLAEGERWLLRSYYRVRSDEEAIARICKAHRIR